MSARPFFVVALAIVVAVCARPRTAHAGELDMTLAEGMNGESDGTTIVINGHVLRSGLPRDPFDIDDFVAAGDDEPGDDSPNAGRPPASRRLIVARAADRPYVLRVYETSARPRAVLGELTAALLAHGFVAATRTPAGGTFFRGSVDVTIHAEQSGPTTLASVLEVGVR